MRFDSTQNKCFHHQQKSSKNKNKNKSKNKSKNKNNQCKPWELWGCEEHHWVAPYHHGREPVCHNPLPQNHSKEWLKGSWEFWPSFLRPKTNSSLKSKNRNQWDTRQHTYTHQIQPKSKTIKWSYQIGQIAFVFHHRSCHSQHTSFRFDRRRKFMQKDFNDCGQMRIFCTRVHFLCDHYFFLIWFVKFLSKLNIIIGTGCMYVVVCLIDFCSCFSN